MRDRIEDEFNSEINNESQSQIIKEEVSLIQSNNDIE